MNPGLFSNPTPLESVFWFCALAGTLFFILRVILMFVGSDGGDGGGDVSGGDFADDVGHGAHSDVVFEIISINSITAFIMMFGWTGLTCYKQFSMGSTASIMIALLIGVVCMLITASIFKAAQKLTSPGAKFDVKDTVGMMATVYQKIPEGGKGVIQINMPGRMSRELDAVAESGEEIPSFKVVKVVKVIDNRTVIVTKKVVY